MVEFWVCASHSRYLAQTEQSSASTLGFHEPKRPKGRPARALACARGAALWPAADNFFQHLAGGALAAWQRISRHPVPLAMGCVALGSYRCCGELVVLLVFVFLLAFSVISEELRGIGGFIGDSL